MTNPTPEYELANKMAKHIIGESIVTWTDEACKSCVAIAKEALEAARKEEREQYEKLMWILSEWERLIESSPGWEGEKFLHTDEGTMLMEEYEAIRARGKVNE